MAPAQAGPRAHGRRHWPGAKICAGAALVLLLLLGLCPLHLLADTKPAPGAIVASVFFIAKSENKNEVHYAIQVDEQCRPFGNHPVYGYWRELESGPQVVSPLLHHELPAYGLNAPRAIRRDVSGGQVQLSLRGFPDRAVSVETFRGARGCEARATTLILKQAAVLQSIYVKIGFLFSVDYAILRGQRLSDGSAVQEKIDE
jgi:hypothetical protein